MMEMQTRPEGARLPDPRDCGAGRSPDHFGAPGPAAGAILLQPPGIRPGQDSEVPVPALLRVVVCGEARSGKSALLNALLREQVVPDNLGAKTRPWVSLRGGGTHLIRQCQDMAGIREVADSEALRNAEQIHLVSDLPHLSGIKLTELPLTTAAELSPAQIAAVGAADALIWVTIGSQAWRHSERAILDQLEATRPARGLIVISRADKLRSDEDRAKIIARVRREAAPCYRDVMFLGAARPALEQSMISEEIWRGTGGMELAGYLAAWREALALDGSFPGVAARHRPDLS